MNATEIIGFSAMCLSSIKHVPQIYKIHNEDNVESFSKFTLVDSWFLTSNKKGKSVMSRGLKVTILF